MTTAKLITERFVFTGGTVRRGGKYPVIEGVLLCGSTSANKRRYRPEAFAGDRVKRYEGRPVYLDHGTGKGRGYRDKIGWIENPRVRADGMPVGDIAIKPTHECAESVLWDAENKPDFAGMSHVAHCQTRPAADGWEDVTEMVEAESVDIVVDPATTKGFYEHRNRRKEGRHVGFTRKQLVEWLARHPMATTKQVGAAKRLVEMDGDQGPDMPAMDAPPADSAAPDQTLDAAFIKAAVDEMQECMDSKGDPEKLKKCLGKLKKMLVAHAEITADDDGDDDDDGDTDAADDDIDQESRRVRSGAVMESLKICTEARYRPDASELAILARAPRSDRPALVSKFKQLAEAHERPTSAGRGRISPDALGTGRKREGAPPTDGKAFAEWLGATQN